MEFCVETVMLTKKSDFLVFEIYSRQHEDLHEDQHPTTTAYWHKTEQTNLKPPG